MAIRPLEGWMLNVAVQLDQHRPGFAGDYLRASDERRQVIASFCAQAERRGAGAAIDAINLLDRADHRSILREAYGDVPLGLRGALRRCGPQPFDPSFYGVLVKTMAHPKHRAVSRTIQRIDRLTPERLRIIRALPEVVCSSELVQSIRSIREARDLTDAIRLLAAEEIDQHSFHSAIRRCSTNEALLACVQRWVLKLALPPNPVSASGGYRHIVTVAELRRAGQRYRNCMQRFTTGVLEGTECFALFEPRHGVRGLVVHLRRYAGEWKLEDCFGPSNSMPHPALQAEAENFLSARGIVRRVRECAPVGRWSALKRFTAPALFAHDDWL